MAEPDTWLGSFFASRFEAAKIGYRTILQDQPPTLHDLGFQEILELALASDFPGGRHYVRDYMEKEKIGKIQTIIYGKSQSYIGNYQGFSTAENPFRTPFSVRLEDENRERSHDPPQLYGKRSQRTPLYAYAQAGDNTCFGGRIRHYYTTVTATHLKRKPTTHEEGDTMTPNEELQFLTPYSPPWDAGV